jgi:methylated-DNA-[protein]-cysteine S-methyltransferase
MSPTDDLIDRLRDALPTSPEQMNRLRERLAAAAQTARLLDVAYQVVDSPLGPLLIAATDVGLVRVAFALEDHDRVVQALSDQISPRVLSSATRLDAVARELDEYFAGERRAFDIPVDWRLSHGFRSTVLHHLPDVGYGTTASYATVAQLSGSPKAVRAVGTACATNPVPIVVPCHRVVRSDGTMGNYRGGPEAKALLLSLEAGPVTPVELTT